MAGNGENSGVCVCCVMLTYQATEKLIVKDITEITVKERKVDYSKSFKAKCNKLKFQKENLKCQQSCFISTNINEAWTDVSFALSNVIAKCGMPYSSNEIIKECIVSAMKILSSSVTYKQQQVRAYKTG
jgi:hypothetical protein